MLSLYFSPGACSLAPHIVLESIGVSFEAILTPISQGATRNAEFLKLNPNGQVPVLVDEGRVLVETPAILIYISKKYGESALIPTELWREAQMFAWFNWLSANLLTRAFSMFFRPNLFVPEGDTTEAVKLQGRSLIEKYSKQLEGELNSSFALGEQMTVLDPYLVVFYRWARIAGVEMERNSPKWTAHTARMLTYSSTRRALEREGISIWS